MANELPVNVDLNWGQGMGGLAAHRLLVIDDDELFLEIARFNLESPLKKGL